MMKFQFSGLIILFVAALSSPAHAVVHGKLVPDGQMNFVAKIVMVDANMQISAGCTGIFLTDSLLLTAGHCVVDKPKICLDSIGNKAITTKVCTSDTQTSFVPGPDSEEKESGTSLDLGIVRFPKGTSKVFAELDLTTSHIVNEPVKMVGYGTIYESFVDSSGMIIDGPEIVHKNEGQSSIDSVDDHYYNLFQQEIGTFADDGDSGSPLFAKNKVIGILVTAYRDDHVNPHPETGDYFGVYNQAVRLNNKEASAFIKNALSN